MAATPGIRKRHSRRCRSRAGGTCTCQPSVEAWVYSKREGRKLYKSFSGPGAASAAKQWRADATSAVRKGRLRRSPRKTIRQAAEELVAGMRDGSVLSKRKRRFKPSVIRSYERNLGLLPEQRQRAPERLLEPFGEVLLGDLDRELVQDYCDRLRADGWSPSTIHNTLDPLRVIYRRARRRDEVAIDPFEGLELEEPRGKRERIASPAEADRLLDALPEDERALWATSFKAGLRRGELRALRVDDIDLAAGVIRVRRGWDDCEGELEDGKTDNAERDVPIVGALRNELVAHLRRTGRRGGDLVFGRTAADPFVPSTVRRTARKAWGWEEVANPEPGGPERVWAKARDDALEPITLHEGRHTFASLLIAAGVDAKQVSEYMGHGSIQITFNRYGHLFEDARARAVQRVDAFLEEEKRTRLHAV